MAQTLRLQKSGMMRAPYPVRCPERAPDLDWLLSWSSLLQSTHYQELARVLQRQSKLQGAETCQIRPSQVRCDLYWLENLR